MSIRQLNGVEFHDLAGEILRAGHRVRFQAGGESMQPFIHNGDILEVAPLAGKGIKCGEILLLQANPGRLLAHRVVRAARRAGIPSYLTKGDACKTHDGWFQINHVLGRVVAVEHNGQRISLTSNVQVFRGWMWTAVNPKISTFSWLPQRMRHFARQCLFGSLMTD